MSRKFVTVACKPGGGVAGVLVAKLAEWNFKFLVYYFKLCKLRSRLVVMVYINNNA